MKIERKENIEIKAGDLVEISGKYIRLVCKSLDGTKFCLLDPESFKITTMNSSIESLALSNGPLRLIARHEDMKIVVKE